jgi:hypothetical protein
MAAKHAICPPAFREYLAAIKDRQYLPPSLRDAIRVADAVVQRHRSPTEALLSSVYTPHILRKHPTQERRLRAGEMFSSDDGSVNFIVYVPWPWGGGDPCCERYGVKVGRFQMLPVLDCGTGYVSSVTQVVRAAQSYRAEDLVAVMGHAMRQTGVWDMAYLERGTWESKRVSEFLKMAGVERLTAYQPRQKLIEQWWNPTWTHLSRLPGQIGRFRGEEEEGNRRLRAYQAGHRDPREELLSLAQMMKAFQAVIDERNHERIDAGPIFGSWVPAERWVSDLAQQPMKPWPTKLDHVLCPERRELMVRQHMVTCEAVGPFGENNSYKFFDEALIGFEGQYLSVYFDPHRDPVTAAIFHGTELVCPAATCISRAPAVVRHGSGEIELSWDGEHVARAEAAKKRARAWVQREHRAIKPDGSLQAWLSEQKGPDGQVSTAVERSESVAKKPEDRSQMPEAAPVARRSAPAMPLNRSQRILTDDEEAAELARVEAKERRLQQAGLISTM